VLSFLGSRLGTFRCTLGIRIAALTEAKSLVNATTSTVAELVGRVSARTHIDAALDGAIRARILSQDMAREGCATFGCGHGLGATTSKDQPSQKQ
jgi:hypothetical protein